MPVKARINYELAATLIAAGATLDEAAKQVGAKTGAVVRSGLVRRGTNTYRLRANQYATPSSNEQQSMRLARDAGNILKRSLGSTLAKHAAALEQVKAKPNLQHIKAVGEALEPLARSGKIVHDWGSDDKPSIIAVGLVGGWDSTQDALDISTSVADATAGSGEVKQLEQQTPQEEQHPKP